MTTAREKASVALIFFGVALGVAAFTAALPKTQPVEQTIIYHDDIGQKHPDDELKGIISKQTAVWLCVGAAASIVLGFSFRQR